MGNLGGLFHSTRSSIEAVLNRNPGTSFVAEPDGRTTGTILVGHDGRRGVIHHLAVASDCRHSGLGRRLVEVGLAALHDRSIGKRRLMVFTDNADGAAFWLAVGAKRRSELALCSLATSSQ